MGNDDQSASSTDIGLTQRIRFWFGEQQSKLVEQARIPPGPHGLGFPVVRGGFASPLPDSPAVIAAMLSSYAFATAEEDDEEVCRVMRFNLDEDIPPLMSLTAQSALLDVAIKKIPSIHARCAAALLMLTNARLHRLEASLLDHVPKSSLIHYVEAVQYDETELKTRIDGDPLNLNPIQGGLAALEDAPASASAHPPAELVSSGHIAPSGALVVFASQAPQKIMQTHSEIGHVFRFGNQLATLTFRMLCPLSVMSCYTAKCVQQQQLTFSAAGRAAMAFSGFTRAVTTDAHASNIACERSIRANLGLSEQSLHILCDVHSTALVYGKTLAPLDDSVDFTMTRNSRIRK